MKSFIEISNLLKNVGYSYFENKDIDLFINEIKRKFKHQINYYYSLQQDEDIIKLEFTFLTEFAIYDYSLSKTDIESYMLPIKNIINIEESITHDRRYVEILSIGEDNGLFYSAFGKVEIDFLTKYVESIINKINKY
jgi:hypothetical protein